MAVKAFAPGRAGFAAFAGSVACPIEADADDDIVDVVDNMDEALAVSNAVALSLAVEAIEFSIARCKSRSASITAAAEEEEADEDDDEAEEDGSRR